MFAKFRVKEYRNSQEILKQLKNFTTIVFID
jgi:hypothetical protein